MDLVLHGDDLDVTHPVTQFRTYVRKVNAMEKRPYNLPVKFGAGLIKAWNLVRQGETVAKFMIPSTTPEPV
jgi:hypothetical protein